MSWRGLPPAPTQGAKEWSQISRDRSMSRPQGTKFRSILQRRCSRVLWCYQECLWGQDIGQTSIQLWRMRHQARHRRQRTSLLYCYSLLQLGDVSCRTARRPVGEAIDRYSRPSTSRLRQSRWSWLLFQRAICSTFALYRHSRMQLKRIYHWQRWLSCICLDWCLPSTRFCMSRVPKSIRRTHKYRQIIESWISSRRIPRHHTRLLPLSTWS